ncbi:hypothetical protein EJ03DRAFT_48997 [Teratosphaeria nubilosa]|uniref:Uncharacterized protein n=1 Tax=Teratosphaeria nubilosa TaxID=161662 RepID=A0A6G1KTD1_9PEZI|nr:hypothetical protein EJ03DRAFT_48997 [Teratosphaeria nubilosa]
MAWSELLVHAGSTITSLPWQRTPMARFQALVTSPRLLTLSHQRYRKPMRTAQRSGGPSWPPLVVDRRSLSQAHL